MKYFLLPLFCVFSIAFLTLCSCSSSGGGKNATPGTHQSDSTVVARELPVTEVPEELNTPELRLRYLLNHFWDGLDFTDHSLSLDTAFMEQNFANFIDFFRYEPNALPPFSHLIENAESDPEATVFLWDVAEKYLNDPNSPMRNGELYRIFLTALNDSKALDGDLKGKVDYQLRIADLNRPGMTASDFSYISREGIKKTLHSQISGAMTLLLFYDPDCESCKNTLGYLMDAQLPEWLNVVAIDAESDRQLWTETKDSLPSNWEVGFALDDIQENLTYDLPAMPTVYLIDTNGKVMLKDPTIPVVISTISQMAR